MKFYQLTFRSGFWISGRITQKGLITSRNFTARKLVKRQSKHTERTQGKAQIKLNAVFKKKVAFFFFLILMQKYAEKISKTWIANTEEQKKNKLTAFCF